MIKLTDKDKTLVVPAGLGNFGQSAGSGGGVTPEEAAQIASAVTAEALDEYDTELQVDLEDIRDAVSGNSEDISALSGVTETISQQIGSLSGLTDDIAAISGQTSANTQDIGILSGQTTANTEDISELSGVTEELQGAVDNLNTFVQGDLQDAIAAAGGLAESANTKVEALSAVTSGLAVDIETLAESNNTVFFNLLEDYGTSWDEVARLFDDIVDAINTGKTAVLISCFKDDGLRTGCFAYCYKFEGQNRIYAGGAGEYFYNSKNIASRAAVTLYRNDYYNLTAVDGHFRYDPIGAIEGYTLPTASSSTKGGIKVGSGLTMNGEVMSIKAGEGLGFSGDTLVVSGGSGEQNYVIVDDLNEITDPVEGMLAYRREYTEQIVYTGYTMDASSIEEGYVAQIYYNGTDPVAVYRSGDFHWDWDNDANGELRKRNDFYYTINSEHTVFTVLLNNPDAYVTFEEGVVTATTSTTLSVLHMAVTYLYNGTSWIEYQPPKVYYLNNMTQAERAALYREIYQYTELTFPAGNYRFFVTNEGNDEYQGVFEVFVARFYGSNPVSFSGSMQSRYSGTILQRGYEINSDGDFNQTFAENLNTGSLANDFQIRINSNGYIASDVLDNFSSLAQFNRFVFVYQDENIQNNYCAAPLKYFYRKNETVGGEDKLVEYIGVEININGTWYKGDWHFAEFEWSEWNAPDTWTTI